MIFKEALLHFIWRFRLFDQLSLRTVEGELLRIIDVGHYNQNAGPDFEYARIQIGTTLWSGQVEIHVQEEDWLLHHHQQDKRYDNTILHVVWTTSARIIRRQDGTTIPTLALAGLVDPNMMIRYAELMANLDWIPCVQHLPYVEAFTISAWLSRMSVGRLVQKYESTVLLLDKTNQDWERVFLLLLGRSFGMKVNALPFEDLGLRLDLLMIHKYQSDPLKIESLLFGTAGFLNHPSDDYSLSLQREFLYLQHLHQLETMPVEEWRFMRMRPYNFPTYRIGQFAALLIHQSYWFSYILEVGNLDTLFEMIDRSKVNPYWSTHYRFHTETKKHSNNWSMTFKIHLAINCFIPMLFTYGTYMKDDRYIDKALDWLNALPSEENHVTREFARHRIKSYNAADSQALLHLKNHYCDAKQCLNCAIGLAILKTI